MEQMDETYRNRVATILQALYATKYAKEDNVPCQIEEVIKSMKINLSTICFSQFPFSPSLIEKTSLL